MTATWPATRPARSRSAVVRGLAWLTVTVLALGLANRFNPLPPGLKADYFANANWTAPAAVSRYDWNLSTRQLRAAWNGSPPQAFSAMWAGAVHVLRPGIYAFATVSDDGSAVWVDDRLVVDNRGRHPVQRAQGTIALSTGNHRVMVLYDQQGSDLHLEFLWARDGTSWQAVPIWALWPRPASRALMLTSFAITVAFEILKWIWIAAVLVVTAVTGWAALRAYLNERGLWRGLRWILGGSLALDVTGIWWGLPGHWAAIELLPVHVLYAWSRGFSHGWYEPYPPLQYYVLSIASIPILVLRSHGYVNINDPWVQSALSLSFRLVSVAAALGVVIAAGVSGAQVFGRRAGLCAAAIAALVTPFVYYAKTANLDVPYLFWFALSMVFYVRLLETLRLQEFLLFAATATCAVCTKDQAYALYLSAPIAIVYELYRTHRSAQQPHPLLRSLVDRRLLAGAATAGALFAACYLLPFNFTGSVKHILSITGSANAYRVFEPTVAGRFALGRLTADLVLVSLGWPLLVLCLAGVALAAVHRPLRRTSVWLLLTIPSYYFGLINVVLYNYDRFVLPICFVLALFGGLALDVWLRSGGYRRMRSAAVACVFLYTLLYAASVDALMITDSRYTVERWMAAHVGAGDVVGVTGLREYLPRLERYDTIELTSAEELQRDHPRFFVLNADYARAVPPDTRWGQLGVGLQNGSLGYRLVFRYRHAPPWPWLWGAHPDLVGARQETLVFSVLRNINPTIEVFERQASDASRDSGRR